MRMSANLIAIMLILRTMSVGPFLAPIAPSNLRRLLILTYSEHFRTMACTHYYLVASASHNTTQVLVELSPL